MTVSGGAGGHGSQVSNILEGDFIWFDMDICVSTNAFMLLSTLHDIEVMVWLFIASSSK